jgi:hypothetical protein
MRISITVPPVREDTQVPDSPRLWVTGGGLRPAFRTGRQQKDLGSELGAMAEKDPSIDREIDSIILEVEERARI